MKKNGKMLKAWVIGILLGLALLVPVISHGQVPPYEGYGYECEYETVAPRIALPEDTLPNKKK